MKEMKANEIMQMFRNKNVVNSAVFTREEYIQQLCEFQAIVSACVFDGDDSYRLDNSITRLEEFLRSRDLNDEPSVSAALNELKTANKELRILIAGKNAEERIRKTLAYLQRPEATVYYNVYISGGEEETELDTVLVTNNGIIILEIKGTKQDITISKDGRLLYDNEISYHNDSIGEKMEEKRRLLKAYIQQKLADRGQRFPVRIESCIVFSTPYKARITVKDMFKKERFCYKSQLNRRVENYYSGTYYESEDLASLNEIISSLECGQKKFQQKIDLAKINNAFAQMMELLTKPKVKGETKAAASSMKEPKIKREGKRANHLFAKVFFPTTVAAFCALYGIAASKFNNRKNASA